MSLTPWRRKQHLTHSFKNEIDNLFNNFFNNSLTFSDDSYSMSPRMDISESKDKFEVSAELPGIKEKDIDIKIENGYLTISAKNESTQKQEDKNYICIERSYSSFQRSMNLPNNITADNISASFKDGILHLDIPKTDAIESNVKKIKINK